MSVGKLKKYIRENGKAKTAVALGLKETNAINNWLQRKTIPARFKSAVRTLRLVKVETIHAHEEFTGNK